MQFRAIIFLLLGLAVIGGTVVIGEGVLNPQSTQASGLEQNDEAKTVVLIAAATDIPFGAEITHDLLENATWPADAVPEGAFETGVALLGPDGTEPRRATTALRAGDILVEDKVSNFGEAVALTGALSDGFRAIAIKVSAETAVGGFVSPGDRVDIVLTQGRGDTLRTGTILQDIRILGIDQNADVSSRTAQEARTITVEVTPRGGQILALSQQAGVLSLTLRNDAFEGDQVDLEQITMDDIWGIAEALPEPVVQPVQNQTIRVRRGTAEQDVVVE